MLACFCLRMVNLEAWSDISCSPNGADCTYSGCDPDGSNCFCNACTNFGSVCNPCGSSGASGAAANNATTLSVSMRTRPGSAGQSISSFLGANILDIPEEQRYLAQAETEEPAVPAGSALFLAKGNDHNAFWTKGFYQNLIEAGQTLNSFGGYLGYDYLYSSGLVGACVGYSQSVLKRTSQGDGHTDFLSGIIHGVVQMPQSTYFEYGLAGSVNFNHLSRNASSTAMARSSFMSYTLDPHFDFGYDWNAAKWCILEPFISTDFIFNFQNAYDEHGPSVFNRHYQSLNSGLFRLEPGLNVYEHWKKDWGTIIFREKISYVRKQPMYGTTTQLSIGDSSEELLLEAGTISQNLVSVSGQIFARLKQGPFFSLIYRGEWGSQFQLNEARLRIGTYF